MCGDVVEELVIGVVSVVGVDDVVSADVDVVSADVDVVSAAVDVVTSCRIVANARSFSASGMATAVMAIPSVLTFDAEGRAVDFEVWVDDLQLFLQCDRANGLSLFDLTSGASPAPPATADNTVRSHWATRDAAARLAVRRHLPTTERAHFSQDKSAQTLYDAVVALYSSPATAALSRLMLPYLFPDLAAFPTVADLITHLRTSDTRYRAALLAEFCAKNPPPMYITLYYIVTQLRDSLRLVRDHFLSVCPTTLTVDLLEERLLAAETSIVAVGASRGDPRTPSVGAASAPSGRRRTDKGKGGKGARGASWGGGGGGGGSGKGGGGSGSGGGGGVVGGSSGGGGGSGGGGASGGSGGGGGGGGSGGGGGGGGGGSSGGAGHGSAQRSGSGGGPRQQQQRSRATLSPQQLREWYAARQRGGGTGPCTYVLRTGDRAGEPCGGPHSTQRCFGRLTDAWRHQFPDTTEIPRWGELAEGDCYLCVPPDPGIEAAALGTGEADALGASASGAPGAGESALSGAASSQAFHTFTLDSGASRSFFRDRTTLTPLSRPVAVSLADPSGGPVLASFSTVLPCPAAPSGTLSGLYLPSFSTNLVSGADLQDRGVDQFTPAGQRVTHCTCARTGRHLATFTRRPGSSLYTLTTASPPVTESDQVAASSQVFAAASRSGPESAPCSCRLLSHQTLLWHHRLGHPSLPRLRGMASRVLVSGLPRSLPPLPPGPAPTCVPCVEGRQRAAPHSSEFPLTEAPLQTLHMDVAASSQVFAAASRSGPESAPCSCRLLSHQTLLWHHRLGHPSLPRLRGMASRVLVSGLPRSLPPLPPGPAPTCVPCVEGRQRAAPHSSEFPLTEAPLQTLHMDVGGEFSSARLGAFCRAQGIRQTFTLPASPQKNGIAERRIGMVMDVARTSMIHAAAPHFLWPFAVQFVAHQLNLQPRVSLPETSPTLRWTGKVGDASAFRVWGSRAFVRDLSADKLSPRAVPCVFLGFPPDAPGWQFYHPTSRRVLSSQVVTFDESVPYYRLFPYRTAPLPPSPLFLAQGPPPVDPLPPQGPARSGVSQVDAVEPVEVAFDSGAVRGAEPAGAGSGGTESGGAEPGGAGYGGAESGGAEPRGPEPGGAESEGAEPGGAESEGAEPGDAEAEGAGSTRVASRGTSSRRELLSPQELREWFAWRLSRAAGAGGTTVSAGSGARVGPAGGTAGATGGTGVAGPAGTGAAGATGAGAAGGVGAGGSPGAGTTEGAGVGAAGAGATVGGTGAVPAGSGDATRPRPYFRREPTSHPASPVRAARTSHRAPHPRPLAIPGTHQMILRPSTAPLRVPLPSPPESSLPVLADPESDSLRAASPTVTRLLATFVTDPSFESTAASALVAELVDFAARCRLDYATSLVAESVSVCPPSVGGECAPSTDVLEDRQEEFQCFAAALPHLVSTLTAPEGDLDAPDIPTPRSYAEAIEGPYSSQWQSAMDAEMASWKSTGTYVDDVPPPGANIVSGMWIFRVKRPPSSPPVFKATDPSLFLRTDTSLPPFYILVYVNDLVFATADTTGLAHVKSELQKRHTCTDLGELRSYLGLQITRDRAQRTITLTLSHMVQQVLQRFDFTYSSPQATPLSTRHSLSALPSDESVEPSGPHQAEHMAAAKRVLRYLCSTSGLGLVLGGRSPVVLTGHADPSWVDDLATQRSSQGYTFSLGSGSVSWRSTCSSSVLSSSCEAEIYAGATAAQELRWLTYLLTDLGEPPRSPPVLYVDNKAMLALCREHRLEHRTKHIALRYFLAREL
ncbi:unnamed protein product [Closterium sp. NIES-54]